MAKKVKAEKLRTLVIAELVDTEKTYVSCLDNLMRHFMNPLSKQLISSSEHSVIFSSDINTIYCFHSKLLVELIKTTKKWNNHTSKIGNIFVKYGQLFKMYQNYMNNHHKSAYCLSQIASRNAKFVAFCKQASSKCNNYTLDSLLILPIQRIPRYQLLLKELIKRTAEYDEYHIDLYDLRNAFDLITKVTQCINDRMKHNDRRQKVAFIESQFDIKTITDKLGHNLIIPSRYFITQSSRHLNDANRIIKHNKHGTQSIIVIFVFNDCMVYGHNENSTVYVYKPLLKFDHLMSFDSLFFVEDIEENKYKYPFCLKIFAKQHSLWISFKNKKTKNKWISILNELNEKVNAKTIKTGIDCDIDIPYPLFVPDDYSDYCLLCNDVFTFLNRRHHCYYCGALACAKCTDYRLKNVWKKDQIVRVCFICHATYNDDPSKMLESMSQLPLYNRASIWLNANESHYLPLLSPSVSPWTSPRASPRISPRTSPRSSISRARTPPPPLSISYQMANNYNGIYNILNQSQKKRISSRMAQPKYNYKESFLSPHPSPIRLNTSYIDTEENMDNMESENEIIISKLIKFESIDDEDLVQELQSNKNKENENNNEQMITLKI